MANWTVREYLIKRNEFVAGFGSTNLGDISPNILVRFSNWCFWLVKTTEASICKSVIGPACRYKGNPPRGHYDGEPCDYEHGTCVDNALGAKSTSKCIAYGPGMGPSSINNDPVDQERDQSGDYSAIIRWWSADNPRKRQNLMIKIQRTLLVACKNKITIVAPI